MDGEPVARVAARRARRARARSGRGRGRNRRLRRPASGGSRRLSLGPSGATLLGAHRAAPAAGGRLARRPRSRWRVPLGLGARAAAARRRGGDPRRSACSRRIPGIALLAFMIPLLGIGVVPALVALFLYSLYPILRNTYTGVRDAAPEAVGAALGAGHDAAADPALRPPAAGGAGHHGRHPDRGGDQRRHRHAGRLHRRRRPGRSDRRRAGAVRHPDDPVRARCPPRCWRCWWTRRSARASDGEPA